MTGLLPPSKCGKVSTLVRMTTYKGRVHFCPKFETKETFEKEIQTVVDRYNEVIDKIKCEEDNYFKMEKLFKCSAWLLMQIISLHPFSDGNGRLSRLLCSYALGVMTPFDTPIYNIYSNSRREDYIDAIISDRESEGKHPKYICALIIESNWHAWKNFLEKVNEKRNFCSATIARKFATFINPAKQD